MPFLPSKYSSYEKEWVVMYPVDKNTVVIYMKTLVCEFAYWSAHGFEVFQKPARTLQLSYYSSGPASFEQFRTLSTPDQKAGILKVLFPKRNLLINTPFYKNKYHAEHNNQVCD